VRSLVNIASLVVNSDIRTETIEGVEFTVIPSRTLPKDVVMNSIMYPSEEVEAAISTLDMSPVTIASLALTIESRVRQMTGAGSWKS